MQPPDGPTSPHALRVPGGVRWAISVAYAGQGVCLAALVTRIPSIRDRFGLSEASLALLLLAVPVVAAAGSIGAGAVAARIGSRPVLRWAGPIVPLALACAGWAPTLPLLVLSLVALGFGLGAVDDVMNVQGVSLQRLRGGSVMGGFHAVFSLASIVGALGSAAAADIEGLTLGAYFTLVAVLVVAAQLAAGPRLLDRSATAVAEEDRPDAFAPGIPWRPILLLGAVMTAVFVAESSASNWSALLLTDALNATESTAALGYAAYAVAALIGRLGTDRAVVRYGPVRLIRWGGALAVVAALVIAVAPTSAVALLGFALLGFGLSAAVPLVFTAAHHHDPTGSGIAVARVNVFNYLGFVIGAPLVGLIAEASNLRWGFAALIPVLLVVPLLAGAFDPESPVD